jgi:plastocyanin
MFSRPASRVLLAVALTTVVGCGGGGGGGPTESNNKVPPPPPGTPNSIVVRNNSFTPTDLAVARNAMVTWTWDSCTGGDGYGTGETCTAHDVVFDDAAPGSGALSSGQFSRTFDTAGTFPYHCSIHGVAMSGKVVVQ